MLRTIELLVGLHEDRIDEATFNQVIWQSVKGAGSPMPAPKHTMIKGGSPSVDTDG
jgi:hypothetical protein